MGTHLLLHHCGGPRCVMSLTSLRLFSCYELRLADAAFEAQDEAAKLRQRLEEIQAQIQQQQLHEEASVDGKGKANGADNCNGPGESGDVGEVEQPHGEGGSSAATPEISGAGEGEQGETGGAEDGDGVGIVELTAERVVQLEIEKWETEQSKREAEKEARRAAEAARQAKVALDEAQTKVRWFLGRGSTEFALRWVFTRCFWGPVKLTQQQLGLLCFATRELF